MLKEIEELVGSAELARQVLTVVRDSLEQQQDVMYWACEYMGSSEAADNASRIGFVIDILDQELDPPVGLMR